MAPRFVSATVPARNEAARIAGWLKALKDQGAAVVEIIVVDGGSRDGTAAMATGAGAKVFPAPAGRGRQTAAGVAATRGDVIWVVHADCLPRPGTADAILRALRATPGAAGGAVGQRYERWSGLLLLLEGLTAVPSPLFGMAFGNQGQFVPREALDRMGGIPDLPLMEGVEHSLLLGRQGRVLHLGCNARVSARAWQAGRSWRRAAAVVGITARYLSSRDRYWTAESLFKVYCGARNTEH